MWAQNFIGEARGALKRAERSLEIVASTDHTGEQFEEWRVCLNQITLAVERLIAFQEGRPEIAALREALEIRKSDPLLLYLQEARNTQQHRAGVTAVHQILGVQFRLPESQEIYYVRIEADGVASVRGLKVGLLDGRTVEPEIISQDPPRLVPLEVSTRATSKKPSIKIPVPNQHLGNPIDGKSVIALGRMGIAFYRTLIDEVVAETS